MCHNEARVREQSYGVCLSPVSGGNKSFLLPASGNKKKEEGES